MKVEINNEHNKVTELYENEHRALTASKGSVSGASLTDAVSFTKGDKDLFGAGVYKSSEQQQDNKARNLDELMDEAGSLKENMKAICNKMDMGDLVEMDNMLSEDGSLTDVNDMEPEEIVTVGEQIRIKLAAAGNEHVYTGDLGADDLEAVLGESASTLAADILSKYNYPVTQENVSQVEETIRNAESLTIPDVNTKAYLMNNHLEPTVENLYMAEHAGNYDSSAVDLTKEQWESILPQLEGMLEQAGISPDEETYGEIKELIASGAAITQETLENYRAIQEAGDFLSGLLSPDEETKALYEEALADKIAATMVDQKSPMDVNLSDEPVDWQKAKEAIRILDSMTYSGLKEFLDNDYENTLEGLGKAEESAPAGFAGNFVTVTDKEALHSIRQLQEIRLMMTLEAAYILQKNGIEVNTTELTKLVEELRGLEISGDYPSEQTIIMQAEENPGAGLSTYSNVTAGTVMRDITALGIAPCDSIGQAAQWNKDEVTLWNLEQAAFARQREYEEARRTYETMSTQIRPDLGDRIDKAVEASADNVLKELNLEETDENRRAVRILAYNDMEITVSSLERVKEIDRAVNNIFERMTPDIAMDMLRDGTDIMNMNLNDLSEDVKRRREKKEEAVTEHFAEYLYGHEKKGDISEEDRERYMALYTIVNKLIKDKGKAAGQLVNQDKEATLGNLVTAYMTRNAAGIDVDITKEGQHNNTGQPEHNNARLAYYKELLSELQDMPDEALKLVTGNELPHTINNLAAAGLLNVDRAYVYKGIKNSGIEADLNRFLDKMDSRQELLDSYETLENQLREAVEQAKEQGNMPDVDMLRRLANGMSLLGGMSRHNTFYIPYDREKGTGAIRLSVIENSEETGTFTVDMESEQYGHIQIRARVSDNKVFADIYADDAVTDDMLKEAMDKTVTDLTDLGMENVSLHNIAHGQPGGISSGMAGSARTKMLFAAAKVFVENFR